MIMFAAGSSIKLQGSGPFLMSVASAALLLFMAEPVLRWNDKIRKLHQEGCILTRLWPLMVWTHAIAEGRVQHLDANHYNRYVKSVRYGMNKHPLSMHAVRSLTQSLAVLLEFATILGQPLEAAIIGRTIMPVLMQITCYSSMMKKLQSINVDKLAAIQSAADILRLSETCRTVRARCKPQLEFLRDLVKVQTPWDYWSGTRPFIPFPSADSLEMFVLQEDWHRPSSR
jgi:hypothetical protein